MSEHDNPIGTAASDRVAKKRRVPFLILAVASAVAIGLFIVLARKGGATNVTRESLQAAIKTWEENKPTDYRLRIRISGQRTGTYAVDVKDHEVVSYSFNDQPLTNERTKQTWTGRGMLRFLEWDLESQKRLEEDGIQLMVRAEFDATYGIPIQYQRLDFSNRQSVSWEVTEFTPID